MKKSILFGILVLALILSSLDASAQRKRKFRPKQRFGAGITTGLNFSQIDGDKYVGYDKIGFQAGLRGIAKLTPSTQLAIEMLFVQKGSLDRDQRVGGKKFRQISLNYIEVPFLLHQEFVNSRNIKVDFEIGASYGRLLGFEIHELPNSLNYIPFETVKEDFNRNDFSVIVGAGLFLSKKVRLFIRHSTSLNFLYERTDPNPQQERANPSFWLPIINNEVFYRMRNYQFSVNCGYMF